MADLTITAANVIAGADAIIEHGIAGATITAGQAVYRDSNRKYQLADADLATDAARACRGIALHAALLNQPLAIQTAGSLTTGATMTAGIQYYLSGLAAGGICPVADVGTGEYVSLVYLSTSTTVAKLNQLAAGVAL